MIKYFSLGLGILLRILVSAQAFAAMPEKDYRAALQVAEKKVLKKQALHKNSDPSAESLTASSLKMLFGRFYQVGDNWDLVSWSFRKSDMRKTHNPQDLKKTLSPGGIFHYEVTRVQPGPAAEVDFKVTQLPSVEFKQIDSRVSHLTLTLKLTPHSQITQAHKIYSFLDARVGNNDQTQLELYPLDIPETLNADQQLKATEPQLPSEIQDVARKLGFHPLLSQCIEFEQEDFFGRSIQIVWQQGDPWPSYLRTAHGISLLIHKGQL